MQEPELLRGAIAFYRLLAAWLLRLAFPAIAQNHLPVVPLPEPAPIEFRSLPVSLLAVQTWYKPPHHTLCTVAQDGKYKHAGLNPFKIISLNLQSLTPSQA